jgi:transposase
VDRLEIPQPWRSTVDAGLYMIDYLDAEIGSIERQLRAGEAGHPHVPLLLTVPGIGHVLAFTIAAEIGDITRSPTAKKLVGYTVIGLPLTANSGSASNMHGDRAARVQRPAPSPLLAKGETTAVGAHWKLGRRLETTTGSRLFWKLA